MIPADSRVGRDDPGKTELYRQIGDCVEVLVREVGRDLHQQRNVSEAGHSRCVLHGTDQRAQFTDGLQIAQARRIG
jgi:hypothetical protein